MHQPFKSANINLAEGRINLSLGVIIDVLVERIDDHDSVATIAEITPKMIGQPMSVPLGVRDEYEAISYATTLDEPHRHFRWSVPETTDIHGLVCYSINGYLLFTIDFGGIRHSIDGAFSVVIPESFVYFRTRIAG